MNAKDYIYNALGESMKAVKDDIEGLSSYIDMDFDDYFGSLNSQIVEDENGTEVLSKVADKYVEGKVVCTAKEGREMFDDIRDSLLSDIIYDLLDNASRCCDELIGLSEYAIKEIKYSSDEYVLEDDYDDLEFYFEDNDEITVFVDSSYEDLFFFANENCRNCDPYTFAKLIGCTHYFDDRGTIWNNEQDPHMYQYGRTLYYKQKEQ